MLRPFHMSRNLSSIVLILLLSSDLVAQPTWRRTYGGYGTETANSVAETADGDLLVTGTSGSFGNGASDIYALLLDPNGDPIWTRTFGTSGVDEGVSGRVLEDGFIFAGTTSNGEQGGYDFLLVRTDQSGEVLWQRNYGTVDWDLCHSMEVLSDGFLLGGISYGTGAPLGQGYLVRTDLLGDVLWSTTIDGTHGSSCNAIAVAPDDGFAISGSIGTAEGVDDGYIARFASDGEMMWDLTIGGDSADAFTGVILTDDGGVTVNGITSSQSTVTWVYMAGTNATGDLIWERYLGNEADAGGTGIARAHGTGFVVTGYNTLNLGEPDMIFTELNAQGYFQTGNNYGNGRPALGNALLATNDGGYIVVGWSEEYGPGNRSCYVVKTDGTGQTNSLVVETYFDPVSIPSITSQPLLTLSPCPALAGTSVSIGKGTADHRSYRLMNMQGQLVDTGRVISGSIFLRADLRGAYVLEVLDLQGMRSRFRAIIAGN